MIIGISGLTIERRKWHQFSTRMGNAGAGKDEAAKRLVSQHKFISIGFADPMKRFCQDVYNFTDDQLWGPSESRNREDTRFPRGSMASKGMVDGKNSPFCLTPRYALQRLGEEWGRNCYSSTWSDYATKMAKKIQEGGWDYSPQKGLVRNGCAPSRNVVISDLRYQNELGSIRNAGGYLIRCKRDVDRLKVVPNHRSELDLLRVPDSEFDWVIENNGTLQDLYLKVDQMMSILLRSWP